MIQILPKFCAKDKKASKAYKIFQEKYAPLYEEAEREFISEHFWDFLDNNDAPDIMMQIYTELGLYDKRKNFYDEHINRIETLFGLDRDIVEVGSGYIPAFANNVAKKQLSINKGTITIYEPLLIKAEPKYPNMTVHREEFTAQTKVTASLGVGILPCEATETIIRSFCKNRIDFYIAMCGCVHDYSYFFYPSPSSYQNYIINLTKSLLEEYDNGSLEVDRLNDDFNLDYPILYNRRK